LSSNTAKRSSNYSSGGHDHDMSQVDNTDGSALQKVKDDDGPVDTRVMDEDASVQEQGSSAPAFYTPSMMLNTMNETMANVGGSVELKRKLDDGTLVPSTEGDKKAADLSAKMRQSAEEVFGMSFGEKVAWALERRKAGNDLFASGEFQEAMDVYMTALVAVSKEEAEEKESDVKVALPVLLNLAQCALNLGNASKVVAFCDHALSLKSGAGAKSAKVRYRRGKGKLMVGDYKAARADLEAALELCQEDGDERRAVERELKKLKGNVKEAKRSKDRVKQAMIGLVKGGGVIDGKRDGEGRGERKAKSGRRTVSNYDSRTGVRQTGAGEERGKVGRMQGGELSEGSVWREWADWLMDTCCRKLRPQSEGGGRTKYE